MNNMTHEGKAVKFVYIYLKYQIPFATDQTILVDTKHREFYADEEGVEIKNDHHLIFIGWQNILAIQKIFEEKESEKDLTVMD